MVPFTMTNTQLQNTARVVRNPNDLADPDTGLRPGELTVLRAQLEREQVLVRQRLAAHLAAINEGDRELPDEMDQASRDQEHGFLLRLADKERKLLRELTRALEKFESGRYGLCEGTDEPIGFGRLEARPWARYGITYKEALEREERAEKRAR